MLGMHRSGTSAMSGLLALLGVDLGRDLMQAAADNVRGFWEHAELVEMNDRMLHVLGSSWQDLLLGTDGWWQRQEVQEIVPLIRQILTQEFARSSVWAIKDPRLCRLLPAWRELLDAHADRLCFVHVLRQPEEVARSLQQRNSLSSEISSLLWLQHVLDAERGTRADTRVFVTYDQLLADWRGLADRLRLRFDLSWPSDADQAEQAVKAFLSPALRHNRAAVASATPAPGGASRWAGIAHQVYQTLACADQPDAAALAVLDGTATEIEMLLSGPNRQLSRAMDERWSYWRDHQRTEELREQELASLERLRQEYDLMREQQRQQQTRRAESQRQGEHSMREREAALTQQAAVLAARVAELAQEREVQRQQLVAARELWADTDRALAECQALVEERTIALGQEHAERGACEQKVRELGAALQDLRRSRVGRFLLGRRARRSAS